MTDIVLDWETHDLIIDGVDLKLFEREEYIVAQRVKLNLLNVKGNWFRDVNIGIPYTQSILGLKGTKPVAESFIKSTIVNTEGITRLISYEGYIDDNESYIVSFSAVTTSGQILTTTLEI